jgi:hypothetical protein
MGEVKDVGTVGGARRVFGSVGRGDDSDVSASRDGQ